MFLDVPNLEMAALVHGRSPMGGLEIEAAEGDEQTWSRNSLVPEDHVPAFRKVKSNAKLQIFDKT